MHTSSGYKRAQPVNGKYEWRKKTPGGFLEPFPTAQVALAAITVIDL
jgi:hypothetical protein